MFGSGRGIKFRLFGTPVTIDWTFILLIALFAFAYDRPVEYSLVLVGVIFVSILLHEFGHAAAFRVIGRRSRIIVHGFGGVTISEDQSEMSDGQAVAVSLAGPVAEIALGLGAWILQRQGVGTGSPITEQLVRDMVWVNILWGLANLVPVLPLDGGHVMERTIHRISPPLSSTLPYVISMLVAIPVGIYAWVERYPFGAVFALFFAVINFRWLLDGIEEPKRTARIARAETALSQLNQTHPNAAVPLLEASAREELPPELAQRVRVGLAWALTYRDAPGDVERVSQLIAQLHGHADTALLGAWVAARQNRWSEAFAFMSRGFSMDATEPPGWYVQRMLPTVDHAAQLGEWIGQLDLAHRHVGLGRLAVSLERSGRPADAAAVRNVMARPVA
jgi:Zn-dependent protease